MHASTNSPLNQAAYTAPCQVNPNRLMIQTSIMVVRSITPTVGATRAQVAYQDGRCPCQPSRAAPRGGATRRAEGHVFSPVWSLVASGSTRAAALSSGKRMAGRKRNERSKRKAGEQPDGNRQTHNQG